LGRWSRCAGSQDQGRRIAHIRLGLAERPASGSSVLQGAINAALEALARGLALELAPVRVNAVSPGLIATPFWAGMADDKREAMFAGGAAPAGAPRRSAGRYRQCGAIPRHDVLRYRLDRARGRRRCHCLRDTMLDHGTVRTHDLEGTRAFLEAVLGRKLGEQRLKEKPPEAGLRFAIGRRACGPYATVAAELLQCQTAWSHRFFGDTKS
jgi:hypothetical protein